jgi:regulator of replication initiation timing
MVDGAAASGYNSTVEMKMSKELKNQIKWLEAQVEALELELTRMRNDNKRLTEENEKLNKSLSNAGWAADAARNFYDNGRDGWN